ncbi:unnamed protein product [Ranitomeya imitator]|uniref:G-protein coupled receptors family 3 profile domain-containing protein n=1 Tax=Ranitomeya imitator TaxID=111125 RepID=A0ABN9MKV7_9NEOB|nr:unnamed protein product [Ranitomeya imitator]
MSVIWVVCDRFSKMIHLVPLSKLPSSSDLVPLFFQHVVRLHGIPENIVSDRGSQFVSRFWRAFCARMGIDLSFSSAFHPQTNGQTERTNQTLETYLRCFVSADQDDWVSFLPLAEFALNNRASSATLVSPFFCNSGFHPCFSSGQVESSDCPGVDTVVDRLQQIWTHVVDNLTLSQEKAQRFANRRRCVGPRLRVGDLVWLSSRHIPMKVSSPKFKPCFIGPYRISEVLNPVSFRLTLPDSFSIHNLFHRSLLRRYVAPMVPSVDPPAPVLVEWELEYIVGKILDSRVSRRKLQYLVKWKGYGQEDNYWVFASDVHAADLVCAFHMAHPGRPGGSACLIGFSCLLEALGHRGSTSVPLVDSESCMKCQNDEWPNEKRDQCLPKVMEFISYQNDTMASVFSGIAVFGCLVTGFTFGIFISYRDTPIVRANNRNLSYLLLVSIFLSFLSVFLFLGRPNDATCRLRETSFGFFFSVAVSSLLAKTVMVCVAFKSTKPGSAWRKWLNVKLPYTIVLLCSSVQLVICIFWLTISPPFQDLDTESYPGILIIQCNEGSDIWFYSMLGYLGLLAAGSFILAFLVRTLPDSFNEAKYITFSMLVFISVWISMIPAYLSTRGKNMVAVEIFAVMASSAGLLGCVFFPKCFIILFKSGMNNKTELLGKRKE